MTKNQFNTLLDRLEKIQLEIGSVLANTITLEIKINATRNALGQKGIDWNELDLKETPAVCMKQESSDATYREYFERWKAAQKAAEKKRGAQKK